MAHVKHSRRKPVSAKKSSRKPSKKPSRKPLPLLFEWPKPAPASKVPKRGYGSRPRHDILHPPLVPFRRKDLPKAQQFLKPSKPRPPKKVYTIPGALLPSWVDTLYKVADITTLSRGFSHTYSKRVAVKRKLRERRKLKVPYHIVQVEHKVKGTGIPGMTLKKLSKARAVSSDTLAKLRAFYRRFQYHQLRSRGANIKDARKYTAVKFSSEVYNIADKYTQWINQVAKLKGVDPAFIRAGFSRSERRADTWDRYVKNLIAFSPKELKKNLHKKIIDDPAKMAKVVSLRGKARGKYLKSFIAKPLRRKK